MQTSYTLSCAQAREVFSECGVMVDDTMGGAQSRRNRRQTDDYGDDTDDADDTTDDSVDNTDDDDDDDDETDGTDTTGDSDSSSRVLEIVGDAEVIPFALVDDLFQLDGAFAYGTYV